MGNPFLIAYYTVLIVKIVKKKKKKEKLKLEGMNKIRLIISSKNKMKWDKSFLDKKSGTVFVKPFVPNFSGQINN